METKYKSPTSMAAGISNSMDRIWKHIVVSLLILCSFACSNGSDGGDKENNKALNNTVEVRLMLSNVNDDTYLLVDNEKVSITNKDSLMLSLTSDIKLEASTDQNCTLEEKLDGEAPSLEVRCEDIMLSVSVTVSGLITPIQLAMFADTSAESALETIPVANDGEVHFETSVKATSTGEIKIQPTTKGVECSLSTPGQKDLDAFTFDVSLQCAVTELALSVNIDSQYLPITLLWGESLLTYDEGQLKLSSTFSSSITDGKIPSLTIYESLGSCVLGDRSISGEGELQVALSCEKKEMVPFSWSDPEHGFELWATDGSKENTKFIYNIEDDSETVKGSNPKYFKKAGENYFFKTSSDNVWQTSGTSQSTFKFLSGFPDYNEKSILDVYRSGVLLTVNSHYGSLEKSTLYIEEREGQQIISKINDMNGYISILGKHFKIVGDRLFIAGIENDDPYKDSVEHVFYLFEDEEISFNKEPAYSFPEIQTSSGVNPHDFLLSESEKYLYFHMGADYCMGYIEEGWWIIDLEKRPNEQGWIRQFPNVDTEYDSERPGIVLGESLYTFSRNKESYKREVVKIDPKNNYERTVIGGFDESVFRYGIESFKAAINIHDKLIMTFSSNTGDELGVLDANDSEISVLKNINQDSEDIIRSSNPRSFTKIGDLIYFIADRYNEETKQTEIGLWVTDGSSEGTLLLTNFDTENWNDSLFEANGILMARVSENNRYSLWSSKGTPETTKLLLEIPKTKND